MSLVTPIPKREKKALGDLALGAELLIAVPESEEWQMKSLSYTFDTEGGSTRTPILSIKGPLKADGVSRDTLYSFSTVVGVAQNTIQDVFLLDFGVFGNGAIGANNAVRYEDNIGDEIIIPGGGQISTVTGNLTGGDQYKGVNFTFRKFAKRF